MKCHFCDQPSTVHLTDIINQKKREMHLCEACARAKNLIPGPEQELNMPALLKFLLGPTSGPSPKLESAGLACPYCGMKFAQFRAQGRLGCPREYDAFHDELEPLLEKIHRHTRHAGKVPACHRARMRAEQQRELQRLIQVAVREERYEDAARLRDQIRKTEATDEPR